MESMISQLFLQLTLPLMIAILIATLAFVLPGANALGKSGAVRMIRIGALMPSTGASTR